MVFFTFAYRVGMPHVSTAHGYAAREKVRPEGHAGTAATAIVIMIVLTIFVFPRFYGDRKGKSLDAHMEV